MKERLIKNNEILREEICKNIYLDEYGNLVIEKSNYCITKNEAKEILEKLNEKNIKIPEIVINANRYNIKKQVEITTLFLEPISSKKAREELKRIKNLEAQMEFLEENNNEAFAESLYITSSIFEYMKERHYLRLISDAHMDKDKEKLLVNLYIIYKNIRDLSFRCKYNDYTGLKKEIAEEVSRWTDATVDIIFSFLYCLKYEKLDCKEMLDRVVLLNGAVMTFCELGF